VIVNPERRIDLSDSLRGLPLPGMEAPHFGPVAAALHVAPATVMILAGVEKEPFALLGRTCANEWQLLGRQQVGGRPGKNPKDAVKAVQVIEAPFEAAVGLHQAQVFSRRVNSGVQSR
jgi:hypothetical protein